MLYTNLYQYACLNQIVLFSHTVGARKTSLKFVMAKRATMWKDDIILVICEVLADPEKESTMLDKHRHSQMLPIINNFSILFYMAFT